MSTQMIIDIEKRQRPRNADYVPHAEDGKRVAELEAALEAANKAVERARIRERALCSKIEVLEGALREADVKFADDDSRQMAQTWKTAPGTVRRERGESMKEMLV